MYDDPTGRRRRAEELAREKHPHPRLVSLEGHAAMYEIDSDSRPDLIYRINTNEGQVTGHHPICKQWELFGVCSHAAAAWLAEHERMAQKAAEEHPEPRPEKLFQPTLL